MIHFKRGDHFEVMKLTVLYRRVKANWINKLFGYKLSEGVWIRKVKEYTGSIYGNIFESEKGDYIVVSHSDAVQLETNRTLTIIIDK